MGDTGGFSTPPPPPPSGGGGGAISPKDLGGILTAAFELYKSNAQKLLGVVAVLVVPFALLASLLVNVVFAPEKVTFLGETIYGARSFFATMAVLAITMAVAAIIAFLVQGAVARAAASATVGDPVDIEGSYRWLLKNLGNAFVISLLAFLMILGGLILLIIPGIIFSFMLAVSIPALVVEGKTGTDALKRSWNLVSGNFGHVAVVIIVAGIITSVVSQILSAIGGDNFFLWWIFNSVGWIVTTPFSALVSILLYVDLRARSESLTGEQLRSELARTA